MGTTVNRELYLDILKTTVDHVMTEIFELIVMNLIWILYDSVLKKLQGVGET